MIYLVTVNYYSTELLEKLITSIQEDRNIFYQLVIVNNSPADLSINSLKNSREILILDAGENIGFGRACNLGLNWVYDQDPQAIVWIVNPDALLVEKSLKEAYQFVAANPEVSITGTSVYEPNGNVWFAGGQFAPQNGKIIASEGVLPPECSAYVPVDWVTGCSMLINLKHFPECPQFDSDYFLYYEDFDFCRRYAKQGHLIVFTCEIKIIHHPSSITSRHPDLKQQHSIYSYLLALEKHTSPSVLFSRLAKIFVSALISLPVKPKLARNKLKGVVKYCKRVLPLWPIHF
ncbi:glycosyltransferase [Microcoleus sp. FACHB-68]|uniref:glycosyltransferase n=1 Tax=Microcoleus sp. FACHB-68 TaxID=2692826 RepID=UPI0016824773|nr:glycosyltransferase family 2 protein [Microcoleus sp. FACHB-68]